MAIVARFATLNALILLTSSGTGTSHDTPEGLAPSSESSLLPETDWFSSAGHGVFTHYLSSLQNEFGRNSQGQNSTWDACVNEFDVEAYA